jgi:hypothetical protein
MTHWPRSSLMASVNIDPPSPISALAPGRYHARLSSPERS